jgi:hypothetical protein
MCNKRGRFSTQYTFEVFEVFTLPSVTVVDTVVRCTYPMIHFHMLCVLCYIWWVFHGRPPSGSESHTAVGQSGALPVNKSILFAVPGSGGW